MDAFIIDDFIGENPANVELAHNSDPNAVEREFLDGLATETDACTEAAFPVIVYTRQGEPVAWVDLENAVGYAG